MTGRKTSVPIRGKMVNGIELEFEAINEDWNEYKLEDNTILRLKTILTKVVRTEEYDQNNEPIYFYNTSAIGSARVPVELKKPEKQKTTSKKRKPK